ncbi:MAG: hypothetical protein UEK58_08305, partial [Merdibacter sp.]|nr:hypothetical protein [Merdibacter sp.]
QVLPTAVAAYDDTVRFDRKSKKESVKVPKSDVSFYHLLKNYNISFRQRLFFHDCIKRKESAADTLSSVYRQSFLLSKD